MITDDAILVNMALDGKREAFDELVRKHRSRVLSMARMLVGTADSAEDVAQQAFVAAFANLRLLSNPASFRPWLMIITRRCAFRQRAGQSQETTGLDEAVMTSAYYQPIDDAEAKASIAEMLAELSARSRQVVVMHYLDGCSCQEIGKSLGIPAGTVKRILHESRSSLRASSELTRGVGEMSQKNSGPRSMEWWVNNEWPGNIMDAVLRQSICLTINKRGLTPEQIAKHVDANEIYVREALNALEAEELVEDVGRGRYRNAFVALGTEDWIEISREIKTKSERVGDMLTEAIPELRRAWEKSPKPEQGFDWHAGIWPMLAVILCAHGVNRNGSADIGPIPPVHPASGKSYWAGGRERVAPEYMLWRAYVAQDVILDMPFTGFYYGHLWSEGLPFETPRGGWIKDRLRLLGAVASGYKDIDSIAEAADWDTERVREAAANAIEWGLLEHREDGFALTFPLFTTEDDNAMLPAVDRVSERLTQEVDSVARLVDEKFPVIGFSHLEEQFGTWRLWLRGNALGEGLRVLYNRGALPHPGDPAPANFCMLGWFGQKGLFACEK